jgi:hypothetical protein
VINSISLLHKTFVEQPMPDPTYNLSGGFKPTFKRFADLDGPDFFSTPRWATYALIDNEKFSGEIWSARVATAPCRRCWKKPAARFSVPIFMIAATARSASIFLRRPDTPITSLPTRPNAEGFVASGVTHARRKFALLLRLAFLEGANRARTIFSEHPPSRVCVFSERITFYPAGAMVKGTGTTAYAWFVWDKDAPGRTELKWFKPGYRARYS